jgi:hypothetical protein
MKSMILLVGLLFSTNLFAIDNPTHVEPFVLKSVNMSTQRPQDSVPGIGDCYSDPDCNALTIRNVPYDYCYDADGLSWRSLDNGICYSL